MIGNLDISRHEAFIPPYCPNEKCSYHLQQAIQKVKAHHTWYRPKGWAKRLQKKRPEPERNGKRNRCYQCSLCSRIFRKSTFKLEYYEKKRRLNAKIFRLFTCGVSNREIGRQLKCSEHLVRNRLKKLAQWTLLRHAELLNTLKIEEALVYDGLENFAHSQYEPNHIQQAIGKESLFIYDFNFASLNRKGRTSLRQKKILKKIESEVGRFPPKAIRISTKTLFERLLTKRKRDNQPLMLYSDEHFQYMRVVQKDLKDQPIEHVRISSKDYRNYKNHLFAVNHSDLLIRQHVGAFSRETICFSKTHGSMIQKFALFLGWKNYFRTTFVKPHKNNPQANTHTPAMNLGLTTKPFEFYEFFNVRRTTAQVPLCSEWQSFYAGISTFPRILKA